MTSASRARSAAPPSRPSIPPAFWALVAVLLSERAAMARGSVPLWLVVVAAVMTALMAATSVRLGGETAVPMTLACCSAACALALASCTFALARGTSLVDALGSSSASTWTFEVLTDATETRYGMRCRATARRAGVAGDVWLTAPVELSRGEVVRIVGRFSRLGDDAYGVQGRMQGVWGSVKVVRVLGRSRVGGALGMVLALRDACARVVEPESSAERALLAGCILCDRRALKRRGLDQLFSACGVAHLIAVSGAHISVVSALVGAVVGHARMRPAARALLTLGASGAFVLVCGAPPSAVRAWLMAASASGAMVVGRRSDGLSAVSVVGIAMALVDPALSGQLGFVLSLSCVVALCLFARYATYALGEVVPRVALPRFVPAEARIKVGHVRTSAVSQLAAALVCQVASAPLVLPVFARLSLVSPLASLVTTMPVTAMMASGLAALCLVWLPPASRALLLVSDVCARVVLWALRTLSALPLSSCSLGVTAAFSWIVVVAAAVALLVVWPRVAARPVRAALACAMCVVLTLVIRWRYFAPARVCVLDVGQGDAILVQQGAGAVLVDTGPDASVVEALARNHVLHLDAVVLTHLHADHYGGIDDLVGAVPCERVMVAAGVSPQVPQELAEAVRRLTGGSCREVGYGDMLAVGDYQLLVVWPRASVLGTENPDSLEMVVDYRGREGTLSALLTGDAEREETGAVVAAGDVGDIDFLKVGHHGSDVSVTLEQALALRPEVAVASAGEGNSYGHPRPECVEALEGAGALFLCTKDVGDVEVRPGESGPVVRSQHSPASAP